MHKKKAFFRFYAELNDFLTADKRQKTFVYEFSLNPSVKDAIEACAVPHPEIEVILVNNQSVDFSYKLQDGDRLAIYPVFESLDITPLIRLRSKPLRKTKFLLDENLGKLTRKLRMLGFDAASPVNQDEQAMIRKARQEKRIILTRSRRLLKNKQISHGYWVRSNDPPLQLKEIICRFDLKSQYKPFTRCIRCNGLLKKVPGQAIVDLIPDRTAGDFKEFRQCPQCKKVYWQGSHFQRMQTQIENIQHE